MRQLKQINNSQAINKFAFIAIFVFSILNLRAEVSVLNGISCAIPERTIVTENNTITVTYNIPEITEVKNNLESESVYHSLPGFGQCNEVGKPMLPTRIDTFRIPFGYDVTLSVTTDDIKTVYCEYTGVSTPLTETGYHTTTPKKVSNYNGVYPSSPSTMLGTYSLRGENLAEIMICPVQYDYNNKTAIITGKITYTLTFLPSEYFRPSSSTSLSRPNGINDFDEFITNFLANSFVTNTNEIGNINKSDQEGFEGSIGYIIVTTDDYLGPVSNFEHWKKILGYTTHLISKPKWNNNQEVLSAIRDCRSKYDDIQYLIIIGDNEDVPSMEGKRYKSHLADSQFGTHSNEVIPDIYIGRIPVNSENEANNVINKLIRWEMCPIVNEKFYKNAAHCAKFETPKEEPNTEDRRFVLTSEEIRDYVMTKGISAHRLYSANPDVNPQFYSSDYSFGQAISADLQKPSFEWNCSISEIANRINQGCLYALYRGHGNLTGWGSIGFTTNHVRGLDNYDLYPTVFSITCHTGKFSGDCFAEEMLKMPEAGASCVIAASEVSYSGYNDSLAEGIIDAIWPSPGLIPRFNKSNIGTTTKTPTPTFRLGQILEQGLFRMNEQWGIPDKYTVAYQYEIFHLFGDPSMYFFTEVPKKFSNVEISRDNYGIYVSTNGEPASISFYNGITDTAYKYETDKIYFPTDDQENTIVCLTGHNRLTYLDGVTIPISEEIESKPSILNCTVTDRSTASVSILLGNKSKNASICISDIAGFHTCSTEINDDINLSEIELPLTLNKGVYIVSLYVDGMIIETKKLIK